MRLLLAIGITLTMAAGAALAQCPSCSNTAGCSAMSMSGQTGGLAGLKLVNPTGDTIRLSEHIGMMPIVMFIAGTDVASGEAADVVQAAVSAQGEQAPMLVYVLAAGSKSARAFATSHDLTGLVLVDQKRTALAAAVADTMPVALFIDRSGAIVKADAKLSEASVNEGLKAMAKSDPTLKDPVCGMTVTRDRAAATYEYQGKNYYFCSKVCKDNFITDPQKYLAR